MKLVDVCERMHRTGVVHTNLKPHKIYINDDDEIQLVDMEFAQDIEDKEKV